MRPLRTTSSNNNTVPSAADLATSSPSSSATSTSRPPRLATEVVGGGGGGTRSSRRAQNNSRRASRQQQQSYHFNNIEANMPVNIWGVDHRDVWRTCFCFHVRTVTIFIGVCHLMVYILYLSFLAAVFMYDAGNEQGLGKPVVIRPEQIPTPVSVSNNNVRYSESLTSGDHTPKLDSLTSDHRSRLDPLTMVDPKKANSQVVLLTMCNMLITLLMVYGAVRGKPSYLMPFFVLRVFDFCIFCLTMVGYFSYLPNVTDSISHSPWIPNREFLLDMDPQLLSLLALVTIVIFIAVKAYIIGVVWNCYKYLMLRNSVIRTVIAYRHDDPSNLMGLQQNLLPDLPDYDTAVNDPRYAKKPLDGTTSASSVTTTNGTVLTASSVVVPPPPYSVAVAAEPLTFNFPIMSEENLQQAASAPPPPQAVASEISTNTDTAVEADLNVEPTEITQPAHDANNTAQNEHQVIEVVPVVQKATSVTITEGEQ